MQLLRATLPAAFALVVLSACGAAPPEACVKFIECAEDYATAFDVSAPDTSAYDDDGDCWLDPVTAAACEEQCLDTAAAYERVFLDAGEDPERCAGAIDRRESAGDQDA